MNEPIVLVFDAKTRKLTRTLLADGITGGVIWGLRYLADGSLVGRLRRDRAAGSSCSGSPGPTRIIIGSTCPDVGPRAGRPPRRPADRDGPPRRLCADHPAGRREGLIDRRSGPRAEEIHAATPSAGGAGHRRDIRSSPGGSPSRPGRSACSGWGWSTSTPCARPARPNGPATGGPPARSVIYIFLSGGLAQHDSFDLKPDAPDEIRGEFRPIATRTPGVHICEHLPLLAARSHLWSLVRSLTHPSNDHSAGHHIMLTGRSDLPAGLQPEPAAGRATGPRSPPSPGRSSPPRNNLPPAVVLPERLVHNTGPGHPRPVRRRRWGRSATPGSSRRRPSTRPPTGPIPSTSSTTRSGRGRPDATAVPGPEPDAARRASADRASPAGWTCSGTSTASAPTSIGRPARAGSTPTARRPSRC